MTRRVTLEILYEMGFERQFRFFSLLMTLNAAFLYTKPTYAMDRDVRTVLVAAAYGLMAGTALGIVSLPLTQDSRGIFLGSSMGLYLGTAVGFYHVGSREDAENPLRQGAQRWPEFHPVDFAQAPISPKKLERKIPIFSAVVFRF